MSITHPESQTFETRVLETEGQKLKYYSEKTNRMEDLKENEKLFINLSLKDILINISSSVISIINEIIEKGIKTPHDLITIIGRGDRLIYVGIIILFITFGVYVVDII